MKIAFDAKRALNNGTGLGNHARILLNALVRDFPDNEYLLFTPKIKDRFLELLEGNFSIHLPECKQGRFVHPVQSFAFYNAIAQLLVAFKRGSAWRSWGITADLKAERVDLYHGLSNELPFNMHRSGLASVVTIHDLIFLRHKDQYPSIDRAVYKAKTKYAINKANHIIAVSEETKQHIIEAYNADSARITVIHPSVDPQFYVQVPEEEKNRVKLKHQLPATYILMVGSFFPRKNHITVIRAFAEIANEIDGSLVFVGSAGAEMAGLINAVKQLGLEGRVKWLNGVSNADMPAIYQSASVAISASLFEGFGAPVLEGLFSRVPVLASDIPSHREAGGDGVLYFNALRTDELGALLKKVLNDASLRREVIDAGWRHAQDMTDTQFAARTMEVYKRVIKKQ